MNAIFRSEKELVVNGADSSEVLLIKGLIEKAKTEGKKIVLNEVLDVYANVNGFVMSVEDGVVETPAEEEA